MPRTITVTQRGLTLSLLLWRAYGQAGQTSAMLDRALALNRALAAAGPILPLRASVVLPDLPAASAPRRVVVDLFS
ncbi:tail protein X [uncultured Methylobacterium sp.]|jgi:phage tail protein X|uniref:tail protein X n=1 Tax=uncultured Methylobacterium sp. TaxID=157278 RepID=UPI002638C05B|nr:tail protein X [uncultured Methylobacterium sp.]